MAQAGWLWLENGAQRGPLPEVAFVRLIERSETLRPRLDTLTVWQEGMPHWARAVDLPQFRELIVVLTAQWCVSVGPGWSRSIALTRGRCRFYADGANRIGPFDVNEVRMVF